MGVEQTSGSYGAMSESAQTGSKFAGFDAIVIKPLRLVAARNRVSMSGDKE
jgi:hypothetical protein